MNIAIVGTAISGNKGAAAMFESTVQTVTEKYPEAKFSLLTPYYKEDLKRETFPNVTVLNANPKNLVLKIIPYSFIYGTLKLLHLPTHLVTKRSKVISALDDADVILDEGGISFVDGRELYLIFNVAILLPGLFMGKRIVKCAQALGTFKNPLNWLMAKIFLPKVDLIVARGEKTLENLKNIKIEKNVVLGADYAFSLRLSKEDTKGVEEYLQNPIFQNDKLVGICPSTVIEEYCEKNNKDYAQIMADFTDYLIEEKDRPVAIIPHSIRPHTEKRKNNDLPICKLIYEKVKNKDKTILVEEELNPRELRVLIGESNLFVGSRFHSMVSSLAMEVPTLVVGWSHKYKEVLDMFELADYAFSHKLLTTEKLIEEFNKLEKKQKEIREKITRNLPEVIKLSDKHVDYIKKIATERPGKFKLGKYNDSTKEYYLGEFEETHIGYSNNEDIRKGAASGGMISSILVHMLENNEIDGALVTKTDTKDGKLGYKTFIATTKEEILSARTSVYYDVPILSKIPDIKKFDGRVAVVGLPCQISNLKRMTNNDEALNKKIAFTIGMFCGHISKSTLIKDVLKKKGIKEEDIAEFKFRKGHWRGRTYIKMKDGRVIRFPFSEYSTYQNLYFDSADRCIACNDHTAEQADISCGDVWDFKYKKLGIKHNAIIVRSKKAKNVIDKMVKNKEVNLEKVHPEKIFRAQNRSLISHKHIKARAVLSKILLDKEIKYDKKIEKARWNDYLAALLTIIHIRLAQNKVGRKIIFLIPRKVWYLYMALTKSLVNF
jgi:coenzyme F420-reducing hydrogenase beta subunit/polysaccharide pyruvyl transferase WcaK-like protein